MDLSRIDLNLLVVLDALVEEKQLARAATRLGKSAAEMSQALAKLRKLVGDPVLVRAQGKMVPTARAWELHAQAHRLLGKIEELLTPPERFDPKSSRHTFTLGTSDYAELVLLPALVQKLGEVAPGVRVAVRGLDAEQPFAELEAGRVDLLVAELAETPPSAKRQVLLAERPVAVVRRGHPKIREKVNALTPANVGELDFVQVVPRSGIRASMPDLNEVGLEQHIALKVPSFLVAPMVVAQTDHAAVLPERVARHFAQILPLRVLELPVRLEASPLALAWRNAEEPIALTWLRGIIGQVGKAL